MIVNISQCASVFDETYNVLKFSAIAKQVLCSRFLISYSTNYFWLIKPWYCVSVTEEKVSEIRLGRRVER